MDTREQVDRFLTDRPDEALYFRVMDDALHGIGITAGDVVAVDPACTQQANDVLVVRLASGELVIRKLEPPFLVSYFGDDAFSRSEDYPYPDTGIDVVGVVVSFIRRLR